MTFTVYLSSTYPVTSINKNPNVFKLPWFSVQEILVKIAGIVINYTMQFMGSSHGDVTTHYKSEKIVFRLWLKHQFKPICDVFWTRTANSE